MNVRSVLVVILGAGLLLWGTYMLFPSYMKNQEASLNLAEEDKRVLNQEKINESLRLENYQLQHSSRLHERIAREKYKWVRDGEKIYDYGTP